MADGNDDNLDLIPSPPPAGVEVAPGVTAPPSALRLQYARSSGPGGQNVNKVNTKAELWVTVAALVGLTDGARARLLAMAGSRLTLAGQIHIAADNRRSQEMNRAEAFDRLRELVVQAMVEPKRRIKRKVSKGAKRRRLDAKKRRGEIKSNRRFSE
jgi:ribosome-associated protein